MPLSILHGSSPFSILFPSFSLPLKIFECVYYVHDLGLGMGKLDLPPIFFLLVILGLKRDITAIVSFLDATLRVLTSPSLSPYLIFQTQIGLLSVNPHHYLLLLFLLHNMTLPSLDLIQTSSLPSCVLL